MKCNFYFLCLTPPPLKLEKIWFFGVKSWFITRNTPKLFAPPSARRNFFKCVPLTWNPGSAHLMSLWVRAMVFNATFNSISVISWRSVLLARTGVHGENHGPVVSHWQTLSHVMLHQVHLVWAGNRDFSHEIPQNCSRLPPLGAIFFKCAP
jgi:hypothetical protein